MSFAVTLMEQVYCQVKSEGRGGQLPAFNDFQKNDMFIQYLLLKKDAGMLGIDLPKVSKSVAMHQVVNDRKVTMSTAIEEKDAGQQQDRENVITSIVASTCRLQEDIISCGSKQYQLQKNLRNDSLGDSALSDRNLLGLSEYLGSPTDSEKLNEYLAASYSRYIDKMLDIGLGASTMSYGKFYAIYFNLLEQDVSFSQRFEVMYRYLKKDKKNMAVKLDLEVPTSLTLSDCYQLEDYWICNSQEKNLVYRKSA